MRVLVLGASGMLGHQVCRALGRTHRCHAAVRNAERAKSAYPFLASELEVHEGVEATRFDSVVGAVLRANPDVVVNCIGVIKQHAAARDPILSLEVNSLFPHRLADLCGVAGARLIHVSTDCVFSGRKGLYREQDPCDAEDLYGRSKALGELDRELCLTLRTSIVGWDNLSKNGLLEWFAAQEGKTIQGYRKAVFSGLSTEAFSRILRLVIEQQPALSGLFHVSSSPISKFQLLTRLQKELGINVQIESSDKLVLDRSLDSSRFWEVTALAAPGWDEMIAALRPDKALHDRWRNTNETVRR